MICSFFWHTFDIIILTEASLNINFTSVVTKQNKIILTINRIIGIKNINIGSPKSLHLFIPITNHKYININNS